MVERNTDYYMKRKGSMEREQQSFIAHYKELSEFIKPRRGRFLINDRDKGNKRFSSIINSRATQAHRIATSGMLAGTMSPTRPWFDLETYDTDLMKSAAVQEWLFQAGMKIRAVFNASNLYGMSSNMLGELILFGTGAMLHVDDFENVARFYTQTAGSYMIAQNDRLDVDTLFRQFEWPVSSIVSRFGLENVSPTVKQAYDLGNYDNWYPVYNMIEPNKNHNPNSPMSSSKAFSSVYFEPGNVNSNQKNKFLSKMGFDDFPAYVPRWDLTGEDIYGTDCPAMTALGDIKGLQVEERRKAQGIDKMVNPPLTGPPSVRNVPIQSIPGGITIYDNGGGQQDLKSLYDLNIQLGDLRSDIQAVEHRIDEAFFVDMFLAISNIEGIQPRNQLDIMQRNEERLLQLGPVLERVHGEFLAKLVDRTFVQCVKAGIFPPPPEELQGKDIRVKFISTLAMAQRAVTTQGIDRLAQFVGGMAQLNPGAVEKFDAEEAIDQYAQAIGTPPTLVVPDEVLAQRRQEAQKAQQAADALAASQEVANIAKTASEANLEGDSVLSDQG
jgi:hypothetical protein